jgi:PKD repeat protein
MFARRLLHILLLSLAAVLAGCSAGNSGDQPVASVGVPTGIERFLLFPNPVVSSGMFETDTSAYAQAYYDAIDPGGTRDTLAKFKSQNNFGTGGNEHLAVFRDVRDLGYGRRMTGRYEPGVRVAFFVENYLVQVPGGGYNKINVDAAVVRDSKWHIGTNAIEWSCWPQADPCATKIAKYFTYAPDGTRRLTVNMDGRGEKAMPGPCITCHGGRGDPRNADGTFASVANTSPGIGGDVQARLHMFPVDTFEWSTTPGFTRLDQEEIIKDFNKWVLCTYPLPGGGGSGVDACRPAAQPHEWQGTAASIIKAAYGNFASANAVFADTAVPAGWTGYEQVYQQVVQPYCRTCHIVRGTGNESAIDFSTEAGFRVYADRIRVHVYERGNMPLALLVYQDFWRSNAPQVLADYLAALPAPYTQVVRDSGGNLLKPGRPVANAGPAFVMAPLNVDTPLKGDNSLFATSYAWTVTATPLGGSASIANGSSANATFRATQPGDYTVQLVVTGSGGTSSATVTIRVSSTFPDPATLKFANVVDVLRNRPYDPAGTRCSDSSCHASGGAAPIDYGQADLNALAAQVRGRVNLTEITASPLLRKPLSPDIHNGGRVIDLRLTNLNLDAALASFSKAYYWIISGMPSGGVAGNIAITDPVNLDGSFTRTFTPTPPPPTATLALDAGASIGATGYTWSVLSGPAGATITPNGINPALATLSVQNVSTALNPYRVQLVVSGSGGDTNTVTRDIVINETPLDFSLAVVNNGAVSSFPGTITVNTTQVSGTPVTCNWQVSGPDGNVSLGVNSCSGATLSVQGGALNNTYTVQLTQNNVTSSVVRTQAFTVVSPPTAVDFSIPASTIGFRSNGNTNPAVAPTGRINGVVTNNITLTASASGTAPINFTWSLPSGAGTAGCSIASPGPTTSTSVALTVQRAGTCSVRVTASNGQGSSQATKTVTVNSEYVFNDVINVLSACTACHVNGGSAVPSWSNADAGLLGRVQSYSDTSSPKDSLILVCPNTGSCSPTMGQRPGFFGGDFSDYDKILTWIINGAN